MLGDMRTLVLGGSVFLSRAVAREALRRGHEVVCAARGVTGSVPDGARLVTLDRNDPAAYRPLAGESFDAVVDVASISYPWVAEAIAALRERAGHWTFVSTINVYRDTATIGLRADAALAQPRQEAGVKEAPTDPDLYGGVKVAGEDAVRAAFGDRGFVVRPGLITGPGDRSDRFGYWPGRLSRGGRVLVPDTEQLTQYIDVRDLAAWIVDAGERGLSGDYDAIGPATPLATLLPAIAGALGADVELVSVPEQVLTEAGVDYWAGPRSLPLWVPAELAGFCAHDPAASLAAGLRPRPLADAVAGALEQEIALGLDRARKAGLTSSEEAEILARLG